jgi:hypothetical protein
MYSTSIESIEKRGTAAQDKQKTKLTPLKAIRFRCLNCRGFEKTEVRTCDFDDCFLHSLRMGRGSRSTLKKVRAYCLWCCDNQRAEVKLCPARGCPLWWYRAGRRPQTTRLMPKIASTAGVSEREKEKGYVRPTLGAKSGDL